MTEACPVLHLRCPTSDVMAGGATRVVWQIARNVNQERFPSSACFVVNALDTEARDIQQVEQGGVRGWRLAGGRLLDPRQILRVRRLVKETGTRILHCHDYKSDAFGLILRATMPRLRLVTTMHGFIANSPKGKFYCGLDKQMARFYDRVLVVASPMRGLFSPSVRSRIIVIPNAVDTGRWDPSPEATDRRRNRAPGSPFTIGYAGRVSFEKGWQEYLQVVARVVEGGIDARCIVAGDGPEQAEMARAIEEAGLGDRVEMRGGVEDMCAFYDEIDLLLAPSHTEGLPLVQLEACAMGVPVVATDVGGVGDLISHSENGLLAPNHDVETLAAHVKRLEADPARAAALGDTGARIVRAEFSSRVQAARLEEVYESVLAHRRQGGGEA